MDSAEIVARWSRWRISGPEGEVEKFLSRLDSNLPAGWRRLDEEGWEGLSSLARPGSGWYCVDATSSHAGVVLGIDRIRPTELRGGRAWFAEKPWPTELRSGPAIAWDQVAVFLDHALALAAGATGLRVEAPSPVEAFFSDLPWDVRDRLASFAKIASRSLPLDRESAEAWHEFVVLTFRSRTVIDDRLFAGWLQANGWSPEDAAELNLRFLDHCLLLSKYADEVPAA